VYFKLPDEGFSEKPKCAVRVK